MANLRLRKKTSMIARSWGHPQVMRNQIKKPFLFCSFKKNHPQTEILNTCFAQSTFLNTHFTISTGINNSVMEHSSYFLGIILRRAFFFPEIPWKLLPFCKYKMKWLWDQKPQVLERKAQLWITASGWDYSIPCLVNGQTFTKEMKAIYLMGIHFSCNKYIFLPI